MEAQDVVAQVRDAFTVKRVFGERYEKDGITVIPVAKVIGGAGGGGAARTPTGRGKGSGTGSGWSRGPSGATSSGDKSDVAPRGGRQPYRPR